MKGVNTSEKARLEILQSYEILDTPAERDFDELTQLAAQICGTPISFISLLTNNRQWFKSKYGIEISETPRSMSFCRYTILQKSLLEVQDTLHDKRFQHNQFVVNAPYIRFYASIPLISTSGHRLGTLCVMDVVPKRLTPEQRSALGVLSRQVVTRMELRLKQKQLEEEKQQLRVMNEKLDKFAQMVSHDLKEPIMNISTLVDWLQENLAQKDYASLADNLDLIQDRASAMQALVDGLLQYAMVHVSELLKETVDVRQMVQELIKKYGSSSRITAHIGPALPVLTTDSILLQQVFANLISNVFKYHHRADGNIWIEVEENTHTYTFCVRDDGPGIPEQYHEKVFNLFERLLRDVDRTPGSGIGLATVKKIVEDMGGRIWIETPPGGGTSFLFTWPK
ncbi:sensor histidine kinase [Pontibacter sp. CAU 1760]